MLEFYQAYATYQDMMQMTETLLSSLVKETHGKPSLTYQGTEIDFTPPWKKVRFKDALVEYGGVDPVLLKDPSQAIDEAKRLGLDLKKGPPRRVLAELFDELVEPRLIQPTFITHYPTDISPLSRRNEEDPDVVDRFELFIAGKEIANGFLN